MNKKMGKLTRKKNDIENEVEQNQMSYGKETKRS
jgi:hypothetical protein